MTEIQEGRLVFRFDNGCDVGKYDDWAFYRNQFARVSHSTAVDFVCVHREECWLVEVKDYSSHRRTKPSELGDEVGRKVRDTLAGLVAGSVNANNADERTIARRACRSRALRVALHLEQPAHPPACIRRWTLPTCRRSYANACVESTATRGSWMRHRQPVRRSLCDGRRMPISFGKTPCPIASLSDPVGKTRLSVRGQGEMSSPRGIARFRGFWAGFPKRGGAVLESSGIRWCRPGHARFRFGR